MSRECLAPSPAMVPLGSISDPPHTHPSGSQTTCCPVNWLEHKCSCYWFSSMEKPWPEAEEYCQLENAHLVVVSSLEEQVRPGRAGLGG